MTEAMTGSMAGAMREPARRDDLRIAHVHLRLGQMTLARAELEELNRADVLDMGGLAALAEARWRTGDADGAVDAAFAHLESGGADEVALCIAAEALAADGRPDDARELMDRLPTADAATLDMLFAGMPRRAFWAAGPVDRSDLDALRQGGARPATGPRPAMAPSVPATMGPSSDAGLQGQAADSGIAQGPVGAHGEVRAVPGPREVLDATSVEAWQATRRSIEETQVHRTHDGDRLRGRRPKAQLDPAAEVEAARDELGSRPERALLRLALVLRHDPTYAPAVLELLHLRRDPMAALVRGDAQRLLGRHLEAEAAFDSAAETLEAP